MHLELIVVSLFSRRDCKLFKPKIEIFEDSFSQPISMFVFSIGLSISSGLLDSGRLSTEQPNILFAVL